MARSSPTVLAAPQTSKTAAPPREGHRETVEAIIVAFILALVVRGFEAQAFVIPTGSMAPTLMDVTRKSPVPSVDSCMRSMRRRKLNRRVPQLVRAGLCVNCRYQARLDDQPSFKGDRILVSMFTYDLPYLPASHDPERWDVVVFRYPEEPEVSYIKRLVGLPGETIRIYHGDIYVKNAGSDKLRWPGSRIGIRRPCKSRPTTIGIVPRRFAGHSEWQRWQSSGGFKAVDPDISRYQTDGGNKDEWMATHRKEREEWESTWVESRGWAIRQSEPQPRLPHLAPHA